MPRWDRVLRHTAVVLAAAGLAAPAAGADAAADYRKHIEPVVAEFCVTCHGGDAPKGKVAFDRPDAELAADTETWHKALKALRAGMMPPKGKDRPTAEQIAQLEQWVKASAFKIDPANPDPGHVTVRRLNRTEYRNTVRDLLGVDFNADAAFPPDDTGHGFDTIGDVLSLSPLLLEKYIAAARTIVSQAVPTAPWVVAEHRIPGRAFGTEGGDGPLSLSYYKAATATHTHEVKHAGKYQLVVELTANETFVDGQFDYNKCRLAFKADGKVLHEQEFTRQGNKSYRFALDQDWKAGRHELTFEVTPLTKERQVRSLTLRVVGVTVRGPDAREHYVRPANYAKYFPGTVPEDAAGRKQYARELLKAFAARAYRRPVDDATADRLAKLAESICARDGQTFEAGVAQAMTVILASPRFLFREEGVLPSPAGTHPLIDEYALASRLSYFLWSTMPDEELTRLAAANRLRAELPAQVERMLADRRANEFVRHFVGQWLQARGVDTVEINARAVITRDEPPDPKAQERRERFRELFRKPPDELTAAEKQELEEMRKAFFGGRRRFAQFELNGDLRRAMRRETEMLFDHVLKNDRPLTELIAADYTFLNERLARFYGIEGVTGDQMRLVKLPPDSPRGGVLTQGTVLTVTSNPDRTSPVKRGLFVLDNILGTPPPPPPPDIPALEEAVTGIKGRPATLREQLKVHREAPLCSSCHNRMDPIGLALENFNALGRWRDKDRGQPIDAAGQLVTGEQFTGVKELKKILVTDRRLDFYRCLTEKMLTYAVGRGMEYYDVQAVDEIVDRLEKSGGKPSALLAGVIESAPFQRRRATAAAK
jgi:mono/diheme cytochrome c family protein